MSIWPTTTGIDRIKAAGNDRLTETHFRRRSLTWMP
jgi:hypothetical protein